MRGRAGRWRGDPHLASLVAHALGRSRGGARGKHLLLHDAIDPAGDSWERKGGLSVHERCCGLGSRRRGQGLLNDTLEHEDRGGVAARISTRCRIAHASGVAKALPLDARLDTVDGGHRPQPAAATQCGLVQNFETLSSLGSRASRLASGDRGVRRAGESSDVTHRGVHRLQCARDRSMC